MSADAFARLMSERIEELDVDPDDLAAGAEIDPAFVRSWLNGSSLPEDDQIRPLARQLSLPRSLLREARRVAQSSLEAAPAPDVTQDASDAAEQVDSQSDGASVSTIEQAIVPSVVVGAPEPASPTTLERALDLLRSPLDVLRQRAERRRERALAPTERPSYVEDEAQRTTYQLRAIFTAGGVIALALILRWALGSFGSSLADLWDTLTSTL